jgi:acid phosphatase
MLRALVTILGLYLAATAAAAPPFRWDHVVVVIEENHAESQIIGDRVNAPYLNTLADGGLVLTHMFAITHPSQPNYLHLFSGSNQGVKGDSFPTKYVGVRLPLSSRNLGAGILSAGFTFASYSEDLPAIGDATTDRVPVDGSSPKTYRRRHCPWTNWQATAAPVPANQIPAATNLRFLDFPFDFTQLPALSFVIPNLQNDMHDGTRKDGDDWMFAHLSSYATWARAHNSLLIVTWDEDDHNASNQIPTIFHGAGIRAGSSGTSTWTLHNLLRTFEDMYGLTPHAGLAAQVRPIVGGLPGDPLVHVATFRQGLNGYTGAQDTMLRADIPATSYATTQDLSVDVDIGTAAGSQPAQALVKFADLFGPGPGQIPDGAQILSAKLILHTSSGTAGHSKDEIRTHRLLTAWNDTATWGTMGGGVSNNDVEAAAASSFTVIPTVGDAPAIFDATADVDAWRAGAPNHGWLLRDSSSGAGDGWFFKSCETTTDPTIRPTLEVTYAVPPNATFAAWQAQHFGADAGSPIAAPLADPDADGVVNQLEYALGGLPLDPQSKPLPASGNPGTLSITFQRRVDAADLTYTVQVSSDLVNWLNGTVYPPAGNHLPSAHTVETNRVSTGPGMESVTVRDATPSIGMPRRFMRLLVTKS